MGSYSASALPSCKSCTKRFRAIERIRVLLMLSGLAGGLLLLIGAERIGWRLLVIGILAHVCFWLCRTLPLATSIDNWIAKYCVIEEVNISSDSYRATQEISLGPYDHIAMKRLLYADVSRADSRVARPRYRRRLTGR
jgi:hypothetical protein